MSSTSSAVRAERATVPELRLLPGGRAAQADEREVFNGLRLVRTLAMLSIVGYHVSWQPVFGIAFGLTSLQVIMCTLAARGTKPRPFLTVARKRGLRLLVPWLAWSAVFVAFELGRALQAGSAPFGFFEDWMWTSGTSFHLWFLPFAFVAALTVNVVHRTLRSAHDELQVALLAATGVALLAATSDIKAWLQPTMPFDLWIDGAPTLAFGLALGRSLGSARRRRAVLVFGVALASLVPWLLAPSWLVPSELYARYALAIPVVCAGLLVELPERRWLTALASMNLGVYLVHMLAIRVTDHVPGVASLEALPRTVIVYATCLLAVFLIRRMRVPYVV